MWKVLRRYIGNDNYFVGLKREMQSCLDFVFNEYKDTPYNENSFSPKGSRLTNVLLTVETKIVYDVMMYLSEQRYIKKAGQSFCCGYAYDGILVERGDFDLEVMRAVANEKISAMNFDYLEFCLKYPEVSPEFSHLRVTPGICRVPDLMPLGKKKMLLKYPTGSGKTYQAVKYALTKFTRVLIIVHRQELARDIKKNYPEFSCYLGTPNEQKTVSADLQIVCLNSMDKLTDPAKYDCVVADEVCSLLRQLVDMKISPIVFEMIRVYITHPTKTFIGMDALLCPTDIAFLN
jgi:hypothetical protein